jgi:hypothetical protein
VLGVRGGGVRGGVVLGVLGEAEAVALGGAHGGVAAQALEGQREGSDGGEVLVGLAGALPPVLDEGDVGVGDGAGGPDGGRRCDHHGWTSTAMGV